MESFSCLYTKQKLKKRKTWSDGRLTVNFKTGSCSLYNAPAESSTSTACLDQCSLTAAQMKRIKDGEELEIDFEGHVATVEITLTEPAIPPLKVPKFVLPKTVIPVPKVLAPPASATVAAVARRTVGSIPNGQRGLYDIDVNALDSTWGVDEEEKVEEARGLRGDHEQEQEQDRDIDLRNGAGVEQVQTPQVAAALSADESQRGPWDSSSPPARCKEQSFAPAAPLQYGNDNSVTCSENGLNGHAGEGHGIWGQMDENVPAAALSYNDKAPADNSVVDESNRDEGIWDFY